VAVRQSFSRPIACATACALGLVAVASNVGAQRQPPPHAPDPGAPIEITGEVVSFTRVTDGAGGAAVRLVIGTSRIELSADTMIELPARRASLDEFFAEAPAGCLAAHESGVARRDVCLSAPYGPPADPDAPASQLSVAVAKVRATRSAEPGTWTANEIHLTRNVDRLWGGVTYVDPDNGYFRINGALRQDDGGVVVRINDPDAQQSSQRGPGCGGTANCSPDARFRVGQAEPTVRFEEGAPACIGGTAQGCPEENRKAATQGVYVRVPIIVGDNVLLDGSFETVAGERFFSAQAVLVQTKLIDR
jgi:hypothetical protein